MAFEFWLPIIVALFALIAVIAGLLKISGVLMNDQRFSTYDLSFPANLATIEVLNWTDAIAGTAHRAGRAGMTTMALEVVATARGFGHRLRVPVERAGYIISQLRTHIPGIHANLTNERLSASWTLAREFRMTNPQLPLRVPEPKTVAAGILASVQALNEGETVVIQSLVAPMRPQKLRISSQSTSAKKSTWHRVLLGPELRPGNDDIQVRQKKLSEPNVCAVLRVAVKAGDERRAAQLMKQVEMALAIMDSADNQFARRNAFMADVGADIAAARVPLRFPIQLSATELVSLMSWPLEQPHVAGLPAGRTRHLPATEVVPRAGRIIGRSTMPGSERPIAIAAEQSLMHLQIVGGTGSGKTELAANLIAHNVQNGDGVFLIDPQGKLFDLALDTITPERVDDVIAFDMRDTSYPIGFNLLQGKPQIVANNLQRLFEHLYPQDTRGVRVRQALYHTILTLMLSNSARSPMTFADITPLCIPRAYQVDFSDNLIRGVGHIEELAEFWQEIENLTREQRAVYFGPLMARVWQLNNRRELRNIFGQSASGFDLRDAIKRRKIVLINLAGQGDEIEGLIGSIFLNALWAEVKAGAADRTKPTYLYVDEFHRFMRLPVNAQDMFAQARGKGLAATIMYQYAAQLNHELQNAVANNVRSKVVFQALGDEARLFTRQFGSRVSESDFEHLRQFEAIARIATSDGISSPMTLSTLPLRARHGLAGKAYLRSRKRYGRPVADVEAEIKQRREVSPEQRPKEPIIGQTDWKG